MLELVLNSPEVRQIQNLLSAVMAEFTSVDSPEFLMQATPLSHELPKRLRGVMNEFRLKDDGYGVIVIRGFPVDDGKIGPTPASWDEPSSSRTLEQETLLALCGTLLGDLVAWASEQDGYMIHNVLPIKKYEDSHTLGWGSAEENIFHVEDAFSPYSPDYLGLICMRNPGATGTTISAVADLDLAQLDVDTLFGENFYVRPDDAHMVTAEARSQREEEVNKPPKTAILFGDRKAPYVRLDPPYMDAHGSDKAKKALEQIVRAMSVNKKYVRLQAGDMVFIDNCRVVHGREPFKAKYDGTDRWLKRVKVTHDLRKSRAHRSTATCRKIC